MPCILRSIVKLLTRVELSEDATMHIHVTSRASHECLFLTERPGEDDGYAGGNLILHPLNISLCVFGCKSCPAHVNEPLSAVIGPSVFAPGIVIHRGPVGPRPRRSSVLMVCFDFGSASKVRYLSSREFWPEIFVAINLCMCSVHFFVLFPT